MRYVVALRKGVFFFCGALFIASAGGVSAGNGAPLQITKACQSCHGETGDSPSPTVPRLNGQQAGYLVVRLKELLAPGSRDLHASIAIEGADLRAGTTMAAIAKYYASQTPTQGSGRLAAEGETLYVNGNLAEHLPACRQCHGDHAAGKGAIPRLAGQHQEYLMNELKQLHLGARGTFGMHLSMTGMSDVEMSAIAAYLGEK